MDHTESIMHSDENKPSMQTKSQLRKKLRKQRIAIAKNHRRQASKQLKQNILKLIKKKSLKIAIYVNQGSEISLKPFIQHIIYYYPHISLYKPIYFFSHKRMWFVPLHRKKKPKLRIEALDLVLIPMLGIDQKGHRLGQGGGYYDASAKHALLKTKPQKIAVGFDCQLVECIPHEPHDIRMNAFISEKRILQFKK